MLLHLTSHEAGSLLAAVLLGVLIGVAIRRFARGPRSRRSDR